MKIPKAAKKKIARKKVKKKKTTAKIVTKKKTAKKATKKKETTVKIKKRAKRADLSKEIAETYGVHRTKDGVMVVTLYPAANNLQIAGDFNNWQPEQSPMRKINKYGVWQLKLHLAPGTYHYRLVADGEWQRDPYNRITELNPYGELNSILEVSHKSTSR